MRVPYSESDYVIGRIQRCCISGGRVNARPPVFSKLTRCGVTENDTSTQNEMVRAVYRGRELDIATRFCLFSRMIPRDVSREIYDVLCAQYPGDFTQLKCCETRAVYIGPNAESVDLDVFFKGQKSPQNILIMRDEGAGDVIMSIPAVRALKLAFPGAHITYATRPGYFEILHGVAAIDDVASVHDVDLDVSAPWDLIINWCRAVEDYRVERNRGSRIESFARHIGLKNLICARPELHFSDEIKAKADELLDGIVDGQPVVGLVLQAVAWNRTWPPHMARQLVRIFERYRPDIKIILIDSQEILGGLFDGFANTLNLCGKTKSFMEAAAVVARCDLLISPDTGLAHVAGATGVPTVTISGSINPEWRFSHYANFDCISATGRVPCAPCMSWQSRWGTGDRYDNERRIFKSCRESKNAICMRTISPDEVFARACDLMKKNKHKKRVGYYGVATSSIGNDNNYSLIVPFHVATENQVEKNSTWLDGIISNNSGAEIIIVDNGSCSAWREQLKSKYLDLKIKIIDSEKTLSYAEACNAGWTASTRETLCFSNSDVVMCDNNWSKPFRSRLNGDVAIVGAAGRKLLPTWLGGEIRHDNSVHYVEGWCVWITNETLTALNGWDESFTPFYCEDADLSLRAIYSLGKKIDIVPPGICKIKHMCGQSIKTEFPTLERKILEENCARLRDKWQHVFNPEGGWRDNSSVAVLIPAHVKKEYLVECLDSVKEISSRDAKIYVGLDCMEFAERTNYPGVKFFDLNFREVNHVRNFLVANSVEPFIYFLDADNYLLPGSIEKFKREILRTGADVVYSQAKILDQCEKKWFNNSTNGLLNTYPFSSRKLYEQNYIDMGSIIRRSALPSGNPFDVTLKALHDWDLWLVMDAARKKFHYIEEPLFVYRIHENNLSRSATHWSESIGLMRKKHGATLGYKNPTPRISLVTIAKTQAEIDAKIAELSAQTIVPDEYCYSTHSDLATAWGEAFAKVTGDIVIVNETDAHPINDRFIEDLLKNYSPDKITKGLEVNGFWENFANIIFDAKLLKKFPVTLNNGLAQDTEWYCRLKAAGIKIDQAQTSVVVHHRPSVTEKQLARAYEYGREHVKLIKKYSYYPLEKLRQRYDLYVKIGLESLRGIDDELREQNNA